MTSSLTPIDLAGMAGAFLVLTALWVWGGMSAALIAVALAELGLRYLADRRQTTAHDPGGETKP